MGRLTYRNKYGEATVAIDFRKVMERLAYYEDLEEQGLLHKAPLKDGTPIWYVLNIFDEVTYVTNTTYVFGVTEYEIGEFGKNFWLSEAEAEKALAGMGVQNE